MTPLLLVLALAQEPFPNDEIKKPSQAVVEVFGTFTASTGLGEDSVSPAAGIRVGHQKFHATAFFERSRKIESGKGWIAGVQLEHVRGKVLTGVNVNARDGGVWRKYPVQLRMGTRLGRFAVYATQEILTYGDDGPGHEQTRSLTGRYRSGWYEQSASLYWWKTHNGSGTGATFQVSLRVGKRAK